MMVVKEENGEVEVNDHSVTGGDKLKGPFLELWRWPQRRYWNNESNDKSLSSPELDQRTCL